MAKQTFTTGQVLTAAQMTSLQETAMGGGAATAKTTSYVLVSADAGTTVAMNAAGATTITVNTGLFAAGDTVFIQNLGAGACTVTAGTATVNTAATLALAQYEGGTLYFTSASASIFIKGAGAAAGGGGKLLQVVEGTTTTQTTSSSTTLADTNLTASITPSLNTSKILVTVNQAGCMKLDGNADNGILLKLFRGATEIGAHTTIGYNAINNVNSVGSASLIKLDAPATTSALTYKTQFANINNTASVSVQRNSSMSTIILMEIGA